MYNLLGICLTNLEKISVKDISLSNEKYHALFPLFFVDKNDSQHFFFINKSTAIPT